MLFNSYEFLFAFLPISLGVYIFLGKNDLFRISICWLIVCSLVFYSWWNPAYLWLLLFSIIFNYGVGTLLAKRPNKTILTVSIICNIALLGYFKYTNFLVDNINDIFSQDYNVTHVVLPLAISFFTFQQIAFLVDAYKGKTKEYNFLQYTLFVTFFPQLIAGPIVHHRDMVPQFRRDIHQQINARNTFAGIIIFTIGLFKKTQIADKLAEHAIPVFSAADQGASISILEAWSGTLAYTGQLYFDFSGYSDMAIGLGLLFGIKLPLNFFSPYKSTSIVDFWRRWHITLSTFLKDYLYIGLGGNRKGVTRKQINLFSTMAIGGLWHGAGWNFIIWGCLHGVFLIINHGWQSFCKLLPFNAQKGPLAYPVKVASWAITFLCVATAWVFFRAETTSGAVEIIKGLYGFNSLSIPVKYQDSWSLSVTQSLLNNGWVFEDTLISSLKSLTVPLVGILLTLVLPNTYQLMRDYYYTEAVANKGIKLKPNLAVLCITLYMIFGAVSSIGGFSEFIYFQF